MLIANSLAIAGRHQPLLEPTSLTVSRGELLLVQAEPQPTRTALSLGLSARMRPSGGTVSWGGKSTLRAVRKISTLVDSPEINEPEAHLKVRDLVAEDLALHPRSSWRRRSINSWMERHSVDHLSNAWLDAIDPLERLSVLTYLALDDENVHLAVFDSPDRHGIPEDDWVNHLLTVAGGHNAPAVIAVVARIPANWDGPLAFAGQTQSHPLFTHSVEAEAEVQDANGAEPYNAVAHDAGQALDAIETAQSIDASLTPEPLQLSTADEREPEASPAPTSAPAVLTISTESVSAPTEHILATELKETR